MDFQTLNEWSPTQFDHPIRDPDAGDWLVCPCIITRDSPAIDRVNHDAVKAALDRAGVQWETRRRGHWGPGWYEVIVAEPTDAARAVIADIVACLADYPVLDDEALSQAEAEEAAESWAAWGARDFVDWLAAEHGLHEATIDFLQSAEIPMIEYETHSDGPCFDLGRCDFAERDAIAALIWEIRRTPAESDESGE